LEEIQAIMLKSIKETRKLFTIEGVQGGQVNIKTTKFLLSLPERKQIEVLTSHLKNLKTDYAKYARLGTLASDEKNNDMDKMQLQILIQVIEGLLAQI